MEDHLHSPFDNKSSEQHWYDLTVKGICNIVKTSPDAGLTNEEAEDRLVFFGPNEIETEEGLSRLQILLHQFKDPLIYILLAAAFVTFVLQDYIDSGVITAVVLLNALIGYIQENKAQSAIRSLSRLADPKAHVIRGGREIEIQSRKLVPGDVVLLSSGGRIAADMRLIQSKGLDVNESALTGESAVTRKETDPLTARNLVPADQKNMVFAGTIVAQGRAKAVVIRTGDSTELGKIASTVKKIGIIKTPLQEKVGKLGKSIGNIILGFALLIAVIGMIYKMDPADIFITVVAMAVSAIPEGLPVVLTVTLAIGVRRMASRQAIIRSLPAVETLGSTTVIGSDKTGTLTKNQMTVRQIWADNKIYYTSGAGYQLDGTITEDGKVIDPEISSGLYQTLLAGTLANEANVAAVESGEPQGDPTEIALHVSAYKGGLRLSNIRLSMEEMDLLPFEPERKYMATLNKQENGQTIFLKGAPESVLDRCTYQWTDGKLEPINFEKVRAISRQMAGEGLRVLAMAYRESEIAYLDNESIFDEAFILTGLQAMEDPIRP